MDKKQVLQRIIGTLQEGQTALVYTCVNRRYVTDFPSSLGYLLINSAKQLLLVDGRYFEAASNKVANLPVVLLTNLAGQLKSFVAETGTKEILIEDEISVGNAAKIEKLTGAKAVPGTISPLLIDLRAVKSEDEFARIIDAQRIAEKAFEEMLNLIKPGVSEKRLAAELEYKMRLYGAEGPSFDSVVVSGRNSSLPHGVPTEKLVETGDFVTFDFGALVAGYHSDMTRTVAVGYATDEMIAVYNTVLAAQVAAAQIAAAGVLCSDVDKAARDIIENAGYGKCFGHSTGHGVGLEIHEYPTLSKKSDEKLKIGHAVTCEPGIYLPQKFGVRIEDILFIHQNGTENITKTVKELIIV